jgi:hypothetical protein
MYSQSARCTFLPADSSFDNTITAWYRTYKSILLGRQVSLAERGPINTMTLRT